MKNKITEFMKGCPVPKILPYKSLMSYIRNIDIGITLPLQSLPGVAHNPNKELHGVYRPLQPFLSRLADLYLFLHAREPCLHWFNNETNVLLVAVGADGAPFGRDDTATGNFLIHTHASIIY